MPRERGASSTRMNHWCRCLLDLPLFAGDDERHRMPCRCAQHHDHGVAVDPGALAVGDGVRMTAFALQRKPSRRPRRATFVRRLESGRGGSAKVKLADNCRLPPLNAIRAFDAAARRGGLQAAGAKLSVSANAVGRLVKVLEGRLGVGLFRRLPRGGRDDGGGPLLDWPRPNLA
jgi:hypothetical protein